MVLIVSVYILFWLQGGELWWVGLRHVARTESGSTDSDTRTFPVVSLPCFLSKCPCLGLTCLSISHIESSIAFMRHPRRDISGCNRSGTLSYLKLAFLHSYSIKPVHDAELSLGRSQATH